MPTGNIQGFNSEITSDDIIYWRRMIWRFPCVNVCTHFYISQISLLTLWYGISIFLPHTQPQNQKSPFTNQHTIRIYPLLYLNVSALSAFAIIFTTHLNRKSGPNELLSSPYHYSSLWFHYIRIIRNLYIIIKWLWECALRSMNWHSSANRSPGLANSNWGFTQRWGFDCTFEAKLNGSLIVPPRTIGWRRNGQEMVFESLSECKNFALLW